MNLSIIIPVYNAEKYLNRCIESVVGQLDEQDELIVVNDGSTDKSGIICDEYGKKYKQVKVVHQKNGGEGAARNGGLRVASGDFIVFVDADDYADESMVEKVKSQIDEDVDLVLFDYIEEDGKRIHAVSEGKKPQVYTFDEKSRDMFIKCNFLAKSIIQHRKINMRSVWSKAYRRMFLIENNLMFDEGVKIGVDMLYTLKVYSLFENAKYVDVPIYHYFFQNADSITNRYKPDFHDIVESYVEKITPWLEKHEEYSCYHANYRLNDIILYIKYVFFHEENVESKSFIKGKMKDVFQNGSYCEYYKIARETGLIKTYQLSKRITFWLAMNNMFSLLKLIHTIRYNINN